MREEKEKDYSASWPTSAGVSSLRGQKLSQSREECDSVVQLSLGNPTPGGSFLSVISSTNPFGVASAVYVLVWDWHQ